MHIQKQIYIIIYTNAYFRTPATYIIYLLMYLPVDFPSYYIRIINTNVMHA